MANKKVHAATITVTTTDGGTMKITGKQAEKLSKQLQETGRSAQKSDRNMKALSQQSSNTTKEFAKMATMQGGLVQSYAIIAAQVFALSAAFQFLKSSMDTRNLIEGQKAFGAVTGVAYKSMTKNIQDATQGMLGYREAASAGAIGMAAGLNASQLNKLAEVAKNASLALGRDLTDSFNRLIRGVTKAEPELLDELGIILRLENATTKYAVSIGKTREQLNAYERTQAVFNDVIQQGTVKFAAIQKLMDPDAFALGQLMKELDDLLLGFQQFMVNGLLPVIGFFKENSTALVSAMGLFVIPIIKNMLPDLNAAFDNSMFKMNASARLARMKWKQAGEAFRDVGENFINKPLTTEQGKEFFDEQGAAQKTGMPNEARLNKRQIAAYRRHMKERNGIFKTMTNKNLRIWRMHLSAQEAHLKGYHARALTLEKAAHRAWQGIVASKTAILAVATSAWKGMLAGVANFANKAMAAAAAIGMMVMAVQLIRSLIEKSRMQSDAYRRQKEETEKLTTATRELNDELHRMTQVRNDVTLLGIFGGVQSTGQAMQSADIPKLIQNYNKQIKQGKGKDDAVVIGLQKQAKAAGVFAPELQKLIERMDTGRVVGDDMAKSAERISNGYINAGQAAKSLTQNQEALNKSLDKQIRKFTKIPYGDLLQQYNTAIEGQLAALGMEIPAEGYKGTTIPGSGGLIYSTNDSGKYVGGKQEYDRNKKQARTQIAELMYGTSGRQRNIDYDKGNYSKGSAMSHFKRDSVYDILYNTGKFGDFAPRDYNMRDDRALDKIDLYSKRTKSGFGAEMKSVADIKKEMAAGGIKEGSSMYEYTMEAYAIAEDSLKQQKDVRKALAEQNKEYLGQMEMARQQKIVRDAILKMQEQGVNNAKDRLAGEKALTAAQLVGNGLDQQSVILQQQKDNLQDDLNDKKLAETEANTALTTVEEKLKGVMVEKGHTLEYLGQLSTEELIAKAKAENLSTLELENAKQAVENAGTDVEIQTNKNKLKAKALDLQIAMLINQQDTSDELRIQARLMRSMAVSAKQIAYDLKLGGGTGASKSAARKAKLANITSKMNQNIKLAGGTIDGKAVTGTYATQRADLVADKDNFGTMGPVDEEGLIIATKNDFQKKYNELLQKEIALKQQNKLLAIEEKTLTSQEKGEFIMANLNATKQTAEFQREQVFSLNPATKLYNETVLKLRQDGVAEAEIDHDLIKAQAVATKSLAIETELMSGIQNTLSNGFVSMFQAMVDGTKSFKDSMKDLTKTVLADLAAMFAKAAALKIMMAMFPGMGNMLEGMKSIPGMGGRYGGIMSPSGKSFKYGGYATGPNSGYQATLHGNEAVVPLGNDRSIPVRMVGNQGGGNTVNVSISMNGQGQGSSQTSGDGMQGLGRSIGNLVQQHLQQEMRPGGLLNPQGTKGRA